MSTAPLDESDGIRDKFDYVELRNGAGAGRPTCPARLSWPELTPVRAVKRICPACRPNEYQQAGNPPSRQASTGFAMAARPVFRNRSAGDVQRQRTLDYDHAVGGGNRTAGICIGPAVGKADRAMGQLHRVPCVILLHRSYLAQSSRGVR